MSWQMKKPLLVGLPTHIDDFLKNHEQQLQRIILQLKDLPVQDIVCYGLGTLSSRMAQQQFAVLKSFVGKHKIYMYDPIPTMDEIEYYENMGIHWIPVNEECNRVVQGPTLFYSSLINLVIHCEKKLYLNVLAANQHQLDMIIIVGNSFEMMGLECVKEVPLVPGDGFNNTSIHYFVPDSFDD